jgi:predicted transglutaminase-like cysteine proteinase
MPDLTPPGFVGFAMHYPAEVTPSAPATVPLQRWPTIDRINSVVNRQIAWSTPVADASWNNWKICNGPAIGLCHDFAATKRHLLVASGIPPGALSLCWLHREEDPAGMDHMVLLVRKDDGTVYVLDSVVDAIETVGFDDDYEWKSRQAWGAPMTWVTMNDPR